MSGPGRDAGAVSSAARLTGLARRYGDADPVSRAVTAEWIVALARPAIVGALGLLGLLSPPTHPLDLRLFGFFVATGLLYALYVLHLLSSGRAARDLPHFLPFLTACDVLLLVALSYVSHLFQERLLFFFHLLIVITALRATFRLSMIIAPVMVGAYFTSWIMLSAEGVVPLWGFLLDAAGLTAVTLVCGWFAERSSRAWELVTDMQRDLASASVGLDEAHRELEVLKRSHEIQRDFFAIVSHELRTPLTGIIGYSDLMLLGEVGELGTRQREYVQEIMGKGIDLLNLIDNILNIHKIQSGRWVLQLGAVGPGQILEEALATVLPEARKKEVLLELEVPERLPEMVADGGKVRLVLLNIIANAVRYTPRGRAVKVGIEIVPDDSLVRRFPHLITSAEAVRFTIADSGPGVAPGDRGHIFELFYRGRGVGADPSPSRMGLGLAVAREIIDLHWGRLWFEETPGGGSTFRFTLPLRPQRLARKVALVKTLFCLGRLLEGIVLQFETELRAKRLTVDRTGWDGSGGAPVMIVADRQLLQSVLFNVMNNKIRHAFPGSEIRVCVERSGTPEQVRILVANRGEAIPESLVEQVNRSEGPPGDGAGEDLRHVHVNLALARDIIESHGGRFSIENVGGVGTSVTMHLPVR